MIQWLSHHYLTFTLTTKTCLRLIRDIWQTINFNTLLPVGGHSETLNVLADLTPVMKNNIVLNGLLYHSKPGGKTFLSDVHVDRSDLIFEFYS